MTFNKNKKLLTFYHNNIIRLIIISTCNLLYDVYLAFIFSLYTVYIIKKKPNNKPRWKVKGALVKLKRINSINQNF